MRMTALCILTAFALTLGAAPAFAEKAAAEAAGAKTAEKSGDKSSDKKDDKAGDKAGDKKDDAKKNATHKITQSESYMPLDPFYASILDGQRPQGLLMVGLGLDVPDKALRERIDREMPRLRDAYVRCLMSFAATNVRSWRQPDVQDMADRLQRVTDRYLTNKGAKVLLAQVMIRLNK